MIGFWDKDLSYDDLKRLVEQLFKERTEMLDVMPPNDETESKNS